jgi:hypothetical protein
MLSNIAILGLNTGFSAIVIIALFLILVFEIWMLISAIQNKLITQNAKILWVVGMFILHPFVAIAYYFTDYKKQP